METVYLLLGSNLGNSIEIMKLAILQIEKRIGNILSKSSYYETEPWGFSHEQQFINQVICIETTLLPFDLLNKLFDIENELGRVRSNKDGYEARIIDIDILFYGSLIIDELNLQIPHPRMHLRKFTLIPLAEINNNLLHPVLNKTTKELLDICEDTLVVKKIIEKNLFQLCFY